MKNKKSPHPEKIGIQRYAVNKKIIFFAPIYNGVEWVGG